VSTAASPHARGLGGVVVFADEIHAARYVRKAHTQSVMPFRSSPVGPIGWLSEGQVRVGARPAGRRHLELGPADEPPRVGLLTFGAGDEGLLVGAIADAGYHGLVVEATGGGHTPNAPVDQLQALAREMPVVLASRTGAGEMLQRTYSFPGSEIDLIARGLIPSGAMTAAHARMLLRLLLAAQAQPAEVRSAFAALAAPGLDAELLEGRFVVTA
jgi:L-asparaginase